MKIYPKLYLSDLNWIDIPKCVWIIIIVRASLRWRRKHISEAEPFQNGLGACDCSFNSFKARMHFNGLKFTVWHVLLAFFMRPKCQLKYDDCLFLHVVGTNVQCVHVWNEIARWIVPPWIWFRVCACISPVECAFDNYCIPNKSQKGLVITFWRD